MKVKISPSLERADLLNLESEIRKMEKAGCNSIHFDVAEPRMYGTTKMSPDMLEPIGQKFKIPVDIHLLTPQPNCLLQAVLPYAKGNGNWITVYPEETFDTGCIVKKIKAAGGKAGVSLYTAASLSYLEELLQLVDLVTLIVRDSPAGEKELHPGVIDKIKRCRKMLDDAGRKDVDLAVDGSIAYDDIKPLLDAGANILILGKKTAFKPGKSVDENIADVQNYIKSIGYEVEIAKY